MSLPKWVGELVEWITGHWWVLGYGNTENLGAQEWINKGDREEEARKPGAEAGEKVKAWKSSKENVSQAENDQELCVCLMHAQNLELIVYSTGDHSTELFLRLEWEL